jgi:hypothetical protein
VTTRVDHARCCRLVGIGSRVNDRCPHRARRRLRGDLRGRGRRQVATPRWSCNQGGVGRGEPTLEVSPSWASSVRFASSGTSRCSSAATGPTARQHSVDRDRQFVERPATQIAMSHVADRHGRRARCRLVHSMVKPSMQSCFGQSSDPHGRPTRCRLASRRTRSGSPCGSLVCWSSAGGSTGGEAAGAASRAATQTASAQLVRLHGCPFSWSRAWASALRCAFFRRRCSRSGAQMAQLRSLQIRPRPWASSCCSSFESLGSVESTQSVAATQARCCRWSCGRKSGESPIVVPSIAAFSRSRGVRSLSRGSGPGESLIYEVYRHDLSNFFRFLSGRAATRRKSARTQAFRTVPT